MFPSDSKLPIDEVMDVLKTALAASPAVVLEAPPGAGKTTRAPLALMEEPWLKGQRIVMLEPRRLAARSAADFMAKSLGEAPGGRVGYQVRFDRKIGKDTRVEVVTEGILTRRLQQDPELGGVGLLIFDEYHERSLDADLALALALEVQQALRPDLKILVMSATLDGEAIAELLGGAPVVKSAGRSYPVDTLYRQRRLEKRLEDDMAAAIREALQTKAEGSLLAFLPGEGEIRRTVDLLADRGLGADVDLRPLYGAMPPAEQDAAIAPSPPGRRKVVLATTIAETSLTIEGIRIVVDGGYKRAPRFDPNKGMTRLETVRVSRAAAEQRRGRAGRLMPGVCYRLWTKEEERGFAAFDQPEILAADLAGLALDLACWGVAEPKDLAWLDPPPPGPYAQAVALLHFLGALDGEGRATPHGRAMAALPLHPRLAHMVLMAEAREMLPTACDLAALLAERDPLQGRAATADVHERLALINRGGRGVGRLREAAKQLRRQMKAGDAPNDPDAAGPLLAFAYPDRIGRARGGDGRYQLTSGGGAVLDAADPLAKQAYIVAADLGGRGAEPRIFLAASLTLDEIEQLFADQISDDALLEWDARQGAVVGRQGRRLGRLLLTDKPLGKLDPEAVKAVILDVIRREGLGLLDWPEEAVNLRARLALLHRHDPSGGWPAMDDAALIERLADWLGPYLDGVTRKIALAKVDVAAALRAPLDWPRQQALDRLAPERLAIPSGREARIDYSEAAGPTLSVKLQEMFGQQDTPKIVRGRVPVRVALLSPAGRPLAVTQDFPHFWANVYPQVRAEMRGRYPKHPWPENPYEALATAKTNKRLQ